MAAIAFAVTPFLILGISALLDRRWPRARVMLAAAVALSGMVLAQAEALSGGIAPLGVGLVLLAALIWACYCVALQRLALPVPAQAGFLGQVIMGSALLLPVALVAAPPLPSAPFTPEIWLSLGYLGLCAGALAFWLWQHAIREAGAARGSLFMNLVPISSVVLGALILAEPITRIEALAFGIVFAGIALSLTGRPAPQPVPRPQPVPPFQSIRATGKRPARAEAL
jgi:drug/metabolite transporter (DMT)-like permease